MADPATEQAPLQRLLLETGRGIIAPMPRAAMVAIGIVMLLLVTFAHPFDGNTYGFCG